MPPTPPEPASTSSARAATPAQDKDTPILRAQALGQSIWLDNISRDLLLSGALRRQVELNGIRGVTSNPAIFEKAIAQSSDYDAAAQALITQGASDALDVFERLAVQDIQLGCDVMLPVFRESGGRDGFVSLEVSPHLADDTAATIREAHRLARAVGRANLMIKVPATPEGIPAIQQLISDGINVNVTLLFAVDAYEAVHQAYLAGLEARLERGEPIDAIASVASFFVSRIDASVDQQIDLALESETRADRRERLEALRARVAIANAKLAYARFLETLAGDRWARLASAGAAPQRVLWASTGTKDPALPKTLYVDELIGAHTVNTLPDATLTAFRETGTVRDALGSNPAELKRQAQPILTELDTLGISLKEITDGLLSKGCSLFSDAFDALLLSVESKRQQLLGSALAAADYRGLDALGETSKEILASHESWQQDGHSRALWQRDAALFSNADESRWLGWLDLPEIPAEQAIGSPALREAIRAHPADTIVVVGMGGSSLWPDVLGRTFGDDGSSDAAASDRAGLETRGRPPRRRRLLVLDTTVPDALDEQLTAIDLTRCLFFVSSKSGSTIEPNAIFELLFERLADGIGRTAAARRFIAITDPGSALEDRAKEEGFLGVALGRADVGGRFSALSPFGLLPAEAMGLDPERLRHRAQRLSAACAPFVTPDRNPGVGLGLALGTLARQGRDKLTLTTSPAIESFTAWVEQLVAESTGKHGRGLTPIGGEPLATPARYADDRVFVDLALEGDATNAARGELLAALSAAGHPVIRLTIADRYDLAQEVFRWELATAVVGSLLGLNPFDQPDVEAAKVASRSLMAKAREAGGLSFREPDLAVDDIRFYLPSALRDQSSEASSDPVALCSALVDCLRANDTFVINAFLADRPAHRDRLQELREAVGGARQLATTLDFGPRYLHSTGQLQKGGPNRVAGLHLWQSAAARTRAPLAIPEMGGDFGTLAEAQAVGDFEVLCDRGRRVVGIDLGGDVPVALSRLADWLSESLA